MTKPTLVLITPPNDYKRFQNGQFTDHVQSAGRCLTEQEIELLRRDPVAFYSNSDSPDEPDAA